MINKIWSIFLVGIIVSYFGCNFDNNYSEDVLKGISTQEDAEIVAIGICNQISYHIHYIFDDWDYNNHTEFGSVNGSITISGAFDKEISHYSDSFQYRKSWEFTDVTIQCENLNNDTDAKYPAITGSAILWGQVYFDNKDGSQKYSGSWTLKGDMTLSGLYTDDVSFTIIFFSDSFFQDMTVKIISSINSWSFPID